LKSLLISNTVSVRSLFFQTFCENNLRFFKIILGCHLQINELICFCFYRSLDTSWCAIFCWNDVSRMDRCWNLPGNHHCNWYTWTCVDRVYPVLSWALVGWVWNWPYSTMRKVCSIWFCVVHYTSHIWTLVFCTKRLNDPTSSDSCIVGLLDSCLYLELLQYNFLH